MLISFNGVTSCSNSGPRRLLLFDLPNLLG